MHQQPTPPSAVDDERPPWDRDEWPRPDRAEVPERLIIGASPAPKDVRVNSSTDQGTPPAPTTVPGQGRPPASTPVPRRGRSPVQAPAGGRGDAPVPTPVIPSRGRRSSVAPSVRTPQGSRPAPELPPTHTALICVALPGLAISDGGQLTGRGLEGFYRAGRRLLSRCQVRVAGREPLAVLARMTGADSARFVGTLQASPTRGPDPDVVVERTRRADGTERITLRSAAVRPLRLPVEVALGTDLADLGAIASGRAGPELPATVHDSGLRWATAGTAASVIADPPPAAALASAGLLRWELELPPGGSAAVELRVRLDGAGPLRAAAQAATSPFAPARARGDDPRVAPVLDWAIADLQALLLRNPAHPSDTHLAAGVPWRCAMSPAEALAAARMALPLGTRLAAGTLRTLARTQLPDRSPQAGMIPGPRRDAGPLLPPGCTGTEATLLFPALLAEARRWGLPEQQTSELLPAAERCLTWLRTTVDERPYLRDPQPGGPARCETQAYAHRAALLGADLLDAYDRPGATELRQWAQALQTAFRADFWVDDLGGGRPAAALAPDGRPVPHLGSAAVHLLDTGLLGSGRLAPGLLDSAQTAHRARLFGAPAMDTGWGLRGLGAKEAVHNPFGHRTGAVRVHDTAVAIAGLAAAGYEKEAGGLLKGLLDAAEHFGHRLPEMFAGEQRCAASAPLPHPAACRPAATAAASAIMVLASLAGIRPDTPARTITLCPVRSAPLGEIGLTGLRVAGAPFAVRISRLGLAMVEEAADGLQLGV
ncbi:glycogen debranching N-terminal domain-containing protein [Streptomyces barringtoniae]|uniref:glycogen debranching N-terminal domain-containing protein n=1 Tax=Streptomyces barringtoniae TaxID=2892029 RepID=UPI001E4D256A|nr:glycogen debranching N-terminal domain-containing protein [Streptomyces barringtoniae]MCC5473957.1 glycogen debranching protein [Streptomyces barringtoniae]